MWHTDASVENWKPMAWCYVKNTLQCPSFVLSVVFSGLKTLEKKPSGQQVTGLSSLALTECIPVPCKAFCCSQWHVVLPLEVGLFGVTKHPYIDCLPPDSTTWLEVQQGKKKQNRNNIFLRSCSDESPSHVWKKKEKLCSEVGLRRRQSSPDKNRNSRL